MWLCKLLPVLAVLAHGPLVASSHLTLVAGLPGGTHFDGGVLKRRGGHCHLVPTLHGHKPITLTRSTLTFIFTHGRLWLFLFLTSCLSLSLAFLFVEVINEEFVCFWDDEKAIKPTAERELWALSSLEIAMNRCLSGPPVTEIGKVLRDADPLQINSRLWIETWRSLPWGWALPLQCGPGRGRIRRWRGWWGHRHTGQPPGRGRHPQHAGIRKKMHRLKSHKRGIPRQFKTIMALCFIFSVQKQGSREPRI